MTIISFVYKDNIDQNGSQSRSIEIKDNLWFLK